MTTKIKHEEVMDKEVISKDLLIDGVKSGKVHDDRRTAVGTWSTGRSSLP